MFRRDFLRVGGLTALGLSLTDWLRLRSVAGPTRSAIKNCILIWLDGGPSHLDLFDLKPDAPSEVRGPFKPIDTRVPGVRICEYLPQTALQADRIAIVRSVTSPLGEHNFGSHYLLTGYKPTPVLQYPSYGAVLTRARGGKHTLPPYISVPSHNAMAGEGYLGAACRPFAVGGDPSQPDFKVQDLEPFADVSTSRLQRRQGFRAALDQFADRVEQLAPDGDAEFEQAYRLILSPEAKRAFDLGRESKELRARYGPRTIGQSCLLARRLVEAGVPFVTVTDYGWDTHDNLFNRLKEGYTGGTVGKTPTLDLAYSALLEDLQQRGLLDTTLVILMGEFGRTPKINTSGGRDHWPRVFSVVLAGGGVRGGQVIGRSDSRGESPADRAVTPEDLAHTIYTALGVDPDSEFHTRDGRPVQINQQGRLIEGLL